MAIPEKYIPEIKTIMREIFKTYLSKYVSLRAFPNLQLPNQHEQRHIIGFEQPSRQHQR